MLYMGAYSIYTTISDVRLLWSAFFAGRIVPSEWVAEMVRSRSDVADNVRYGLGFWLDGGNAVRLEGCDAGVSFRSWHDPITLTTHTVISNTADGAWPLTRHLYERLNTPPAA